MVATYKESQWQIFVPPKIACDHHGRLMSLLRDRWCRKSSVLQRIHDGRNVKGAGRTGMERNAVISTQTQTQICNPFSSKIV
jgi:hypothetical protein